MDLSHRHGQKPMALERNKMNEPNMTQNKTEGVVTIGSKDLLDSLVERYLNRAKMCEESALKLAACRNYADAFAAETRRGVWIYAAEMVKQERLSNESSSPAPGRETGVVSGKDINEPKT